MVPAASLFRQNALTYRYCCVLLCGYAHEAGYSAATGDQAKPIFCFRLCARLQVVGSMPCLVVRKWSPCSRGVGDHVGDILRLADPGPNPAVQDAPDPDPNLPCMRRSRCPGSRRCTCGRPLATASDRPAPLAASPTITGEQGMWACVMFYHVATCCVLLNTTRWTGFQFVAGAVCLRPVLCLLLLEAMLPDLASLLATHKSYHLAGAVLYAVL